MERVISLFDGRYFSPWVPSVIYFLPSHSSAGAICLLSSNQSVLLAVSGQAKVQEEAERSPSPVVYILADKPDGILYIGVTEDLIKRVWQHRKEIFPGFTKKYHVHRLVYYEFHETLASAVMRQRELKKSRRSAKVELIENENPQWDDLWGRFCEQ